MTSQLYLAQGIAAGLRHPGATGQDPAIVRSAEIARSEQRRSRRMRRAR
jgi:hypothetical protein